MRCACVGRGIGTASSATPRRSSQAGGDLNGALSAFSQQLASVPAESEEDATPRAAAKAPDASPQPFLTSAWPAERAQQRAFLAQTAASWMLIAVVLAAHVQLLSAMGQVEAVFVALSPWSPTAQARARRSSFTSKPCATNTSPQC